MAARLTINALLAHLADRIQGELLTPQLGERCVEGVCSFSHTRPRHLAYINSLIGKVRPEALLQLNRAGIAAVVVPDKEKSLLTAELLACIPDVAVIATSHPSVFFAYATQCLLEAVTPAVAPSNQIHPRACVAASATLGKGVRIDAGAVIGEHVVIGDGCHIYPNAVVYDHCRLGQRVILHAGAVIGADGLGFPPYQNKWIKQPHVGRVVIGDDVEVGAGTAIDRATLDETVIEEGVKIDNLVHIAHNCCIGAHSIIAAHVVIAGSTKIGRCCQIGGATVINGHIEIADFVVITAMSGVPASISEAGHYSGIPVAEHDVWKRNTLVGVKLYEHLQKLRKRLSALEQAQPRQTPPGVQ